MTILTELKASATTDVATAAKLLGVSRNQAYAALHAGEIEAIRIGGRYRVLTAPLLRLLQLSDAA